MWFASIFQNTFSASSEALEAAKKILDILQHSGSFFVSRNVQKNASSNVVKLLLLSSTSSFFHLSICAKLQNSFYYFLYYLSKYFFSISRDFSFLKCVAYDCLIMRSLRGKLFLNINLQNTLDEYVILLVRYERWRCRIYQFVLSREK